MAWLHEHNGAITDREILYVEAKVRQELLMNGLPDGNMSHTVFTPYGIGQTDKVIEYHWDNLSILDMIRFAELLTRGRQA
ncbi:hypothetical protein ACIQWR_19255 [Streptomyces sp. NPDC098789]|uniref:hypothetical protein n=1 Tax=Streptomyces sp. NPDC098789 TaxID=3366098 RepID=UPI003820D2CD